MCSPKMFQVSTFSIHFGWEIADLHGGLQLEKHGKSIELNGDLFVAMFDHHRAISYINVYHLANRNIYIYIYHIYIYIFIYICI